MLMNINSPKTLINVNIIEIVDILCILMIEIKFNDTYYMFSFYATWGDVFDPKIKTC